MANSQTVVNVPSDFLPGHRNSIFSGNSFPISSQNDVFSTRHMEAPYPGNMAAQTSFGNNRAGRMPSLPGGRQWSQAVFQNTPNVRFVDWIDADTFIQQ